VTDADVEILRRGFAAFSRGDFDEMLDFSAPDMVIYDAEELPGGGVHRGKAEARAGLEEWRDMFTDLEVVPEAFERFGARILVVFRARGYGKESGIPVDVQLANVYTIEDGLVTEWRSYTSEALARESLGLEATS
jgi:uncharacterized protein